MEIDLPNVLNELPVAAMLLLANSQDVEIGWTNQSFYSLTGTDEAGISGKSIKWFFSNCIVPEEDGFELISEMIQDVTSHGESGETGILKCILNRDDSNNRETKYMQFKCSPVKNSKGGIKQVVMLIVDVSDAVAFGIQNKPDISNTFSNSVLHARNEMLVEQAEENRTQFESASKELDDFVYSVSHDLRAPLRRIDGFSQELIESYLEQLDETGQHYLRRIRQGAQDMGILIDDLLKLSRISRRNAERKEFDLGELANDVFEELKNETPNREIELICTDELDVLADPGLLKIVLTNLLSNSIKFTRDSEHAKIEIGSAKKEGQKIFYIKDNGVGFDTAYSEKLFKAFQRLHSNHEYEGTGIGLVTVKRIISSHKGRIWADSTPGEGAIFYFTLTQN